MWMAAQVTSNALGKPHMVCHSQRDDTIHKKEYSSKEIYKTFTGFTKRSSWNIQETINPCLDSKALLSASNKRNPCMKHIFINNLPYPVTKLPKTWELNVITPHDVFIYNIVRYKTIDMSPLNSLSFVHCPLGRFVHCSF